MLINISITQNGVHTLNIKIGSLKEAQANYPKKEVQSYNIWYLIPGGQDPEEKYFGWPQCYKRLGWFEDPVNCSQPQD